MKFFNLIFLIITILFQYSHADDFNLEKTSNSDVCQFFPQPAQSWEGESSLTISNRKVGDNLYPDYYITGWTDEYVDKYLSPCDNSNLFNCKYGGVEVSSKLSLSFEKITDWSGFNSCDEGTCSGGNKGALIKKPEDVIVEFNSDINLTLSEWNYGSVCENGLKCEYYLDPDDDMHLVFIINKDLNVLKVNNPKTKKITVKFKSDVKVRRYEVNGVAKTEFEPGRFYFNSIVFNTYGSEVKFASGMELYLVHLDKYDDGNNYYSGDPALKFRNGVEVSTVGTGALPLIYSPFGSVEFNKSTVPRFFHSLVLAEQITLDDNNYIEGAVSARKLTMWGPNNAIIGNSMCFNPPEIPDVSRIVIKPFNYHLTCESSPENIVEVHVYDADGQYISGKEPFLEETSGDNLKIDFLSESGGIAKYKVIKKDMSKLGDYELTASLPVSTGDLLTAHDTIKYVPYKFDVADQNIVAGQHNKVDIAVKACSSDSNGQSQLITLGYTGSPQASFSYLSPVTPPDASDLKFLAHLDDTNRSADFTFMESGQITVAIEDKDFECIDTDDVHCPVEGGALKGEFSVNSRPYKLAICNVVETAKPSNKNPATTSTNRGFMASGREFSVTYRPIVHPDSKGSTSNECLYPLTENYGLDNGPLDLSYHVAYPKSSTTSSVTPNTPPDFSPEDLTLTLTHTWDEVGTIVFKSDATYLNMKLDRDFQRIGRFYPNYFAISESTWTAPDNQNDVTYLSQNFDDTKIMVGAYAFDSVVPVKNYHLFDESLKAQFVLRKTGSAINNPMNLETELGGWGAESTYSYWRLSDKNASVSRQQTVSGSTITSQENGPFNLEMITDPQSTKTDFGLRISGHDPVSFDEDVTVLEQAFPYQPKLKYGRMALGSSGGPSGSHLNVPLRVEYWNGSHFVKNTDDDRSQLSSLDDYVCRQTVWDEGAESNSKLSGASQLPMPHVEKGEFTGLQVLADSENHTLREQVRFWLRMDDVNENGHRSPQTRLNDVVCGGYGLAQPWLQYNWRNEGDEDPSTVATFGIYRGHDKIIFRGEPGLTGL